MAPSSPFDFTDFGARPPAAPSAPGPGSPPAFPGAPTFPGPSGYQAAPTTGGFDPFAGQPGGTPATGGEVFGGPASTTMGALSVASPPLRLFAAALAAAIVGVICGGLVTLTGSGVLLAFAGWLLAGPAAIGVLAAFNSVDTRRRLSSVYSAPTWLSSAYWVVLATCAVGIGVAAWQIALWAGRL